MASKSVGTGSGRTIVSFTSANPRSSPARQTDLDVEARRWRMMKHELSRSLLRNQIVLFAKGLCYLFTIKYFSTLPDHRCLEITSEALGRAARKTVFFKYGISVEQDCPGQVNLIEISALNTLRVLLSTQFYFSLCTPARSNTLLTSQTSTRPAH